MKYFYPFILCYVFLVRISLAQNCDTISIKQLYNEANIALSKDVTRSYTLAYKAYSQAKGCPFTKHYYEALISLSKAYYQKDLGDSSIQLLSPIVAKLPTNIPIRYKAGIYHQLSSGYVMTLKLELGLKCCLEALKNYELINDSTNTTNC